MSPELAFNVGKALGYTLPAAVSLLVSALVALGITLVVELVVAAVLGFRSPRQLAAVGYANLVTNPVFGFVIITVGVVFGVWWHAPMLAVLEVVVVVVEWRLVVWAVGTPERRTLVLATLMNLASVGVGYAVWLLRHRPA